MRGALMLSMSVDHPDILDFIKVKRDGTSVTGANISVRLNREFMEAVEREEDYILRFPVDAQLEELDKDIYNIEYNVLINTKNKKGDVVYVKKIRAKEYWSEIIHSAKNYAEPGLMYWDNMLDYDPSAVYEQYVPQGTNPCVVGETTILTKEGLKRIDSVIDRDVEVWNGFEWSPVTPKVTGYNEEVNTVKLSDGRELVVTNNHKWILKGNKRVTTEELEIGDKLSKYKLPVIYYGKSVDKKEAYTQGFISADGQDGYNHLWLYEPKYMCQDRLDEKSSNEFDYKESTRKQVFLGKEYKNSSFVPFEWDLNSRLEWLSGLIDGDGTELVEGGMQLWSVDFEFLTNVQSLLTTMGVNSKVLPGKEAGKKMRPNGKGGLSEYNVEETYRICVGAMEMQELKELGLNCSRLSFDKSPNRSAQRFVTVESIEYSGIESKVYCFTDELNSSGVFNGVMTANCGEQFLNPYDSCRLTVLNLYSFVDNPFQEGAKINEDKLFEVSYRHARMGDNLVDLELEYINRIIDKINSDPESEDVKRGELELWQKSYDNTKSGRRVGLGITALADMLAALGVGYDSEEGMELIGRVMKIKMEAELTAIVDLAKLRGPFEGWDNNLEYPQGKGANKFYRDLEKMFPELVGDMKTYGRRSLNWSTISPTGSVSILTQTTSGCEPLFMPYYMRRKKINPSEEGARVDFVDEAGDSWQEYPVMHQKFKDWIEVQSHITSDETPTVDIDELSEDQLKDLFEKSPWYGSTASSIDWMKRNKVQSILQKHTTNAISSCLVGESHLVSTSGGLKYIEDIGKSREKGFSEVSEELTTINHENKKVKVDEFYYNGKHSTIRLELSNGIPIQGTPNHKLLVLGDKYKPKWKALEDIEVGKDYIVGRKGLEVFGNNKLTISDIMGKPFETAIQGGSAGEIKTPLRVTTAFARFLGYLTSNDAFYVVDAHTVVVASDIVYDFRRIIEEVFGLESSIVHDGVIGLVHVRVNSKILVEYMNYLGLSLKAYEKSVPKIILEGADKAQVVEFLRGFTLCSYVTKDKMCMVTTYSERLGREIVSVLNQFGIEASIARSNVSEDPNAWSVYCDRVNTKLFNQQIGFIDTSLKDFYSKFSVDFSSLDTDEIVLDKTYMFLEVVGKKEVEERLDTFDLHIKEGNSYTVNNIVSHNTINLPSTVTEEEVSDIYLSGWDLGLKGQTVYVDGSRSGVLVDNDSKKEGGKKEFSQLDAVNRPNILEADTHTTTSNGKKYNVFVGKLYNKPYEVFIAEHFTTRDNLKIEKVGGGTYNLLDSDGSIFKENFSQDMLEEEIAITRGTSLSLRHRVDVRFIVDQLRKTPSKNMFSFSQSLARVLSKYIEDNSPSGKTCDDCSSDNVVFMEGCETCMDCGSSKCS